MTMRAGVVSLLNCELGNLEWISRVGEDSYEAASLAEEEVLPAKILRR